LYDEAADSLCRLDEMPEGFEVDTSEFFWLDTKNSAFHWRSDFGGGVEVFGSFPIPLNFYTRNLFTIGGFLNSALFTTILHFSLEETPEQLDRGQLYNHKRGRGGMAGTAPLTRLELRRAGCAAPKRVLRLLVRPYLLLYREKKIFRSSYSCSKIRAFFTLITDAL